MSKCIEIIKATGETTVMQGAPTLEKLQQAVGGWVEHVRVLDRIEVGIFIYTSMYVHEEGRLNGLPVNPKATEIYHRNMKAQAAIYGVSLPPLEPIVGDVVFFRGYTVEEAEEIYLRA